MQTTGIVRRVDDLGRVVIPKEIRHLLHIKEGDPLEIFVNEGCVCFRKHSSAETFHSVLNDLLGLLQEDAIPYLTDEEKTLIKSDVIRIKDKLKGCDKNDT